MSPAPPARVWENTCGNCGREMTPHEEHPRRNVPRRGGRRLVVCGDCAQVIDGQGQLDVEPEPRAAA